MKHIFAAMILVLLIAGCTSQAPVDTEPLYNQTLNQQIENLTNQPAVSTNFTFTPNNSTDYEIALDDVFTLTGGNFTSDQIAFLGVTLGMTQQEVYDRLGRPDVQYTPPDKSFSNLEYRKVIGITGMEPGITYQVVNGTVQRIIIRGAFNDFLQGNTTIGQTREYIYSQFDLPDYQDFTRYEQGFNYRIYYYIEKGVEFYLRQNKVELMVFVPPKEFYGVEWVTRPVRLSDGMIANVTEPRLKPANNS